MGQCLNRKSLSTPWHSCVVYLPNAVFRMACLATFQFEGIPFKGVYIDRWGSIRKTRRFCFAMHAKTISMLLLWTRIYVR
jgi:hypothetical protein